MKALFGLLLAVFLVGCDATPAPEPTEPPSDDTPTTSPVPAGLPSFTDCNPATPPQLPEKWTATGFLQPYGDQPPAVARFTFDEAAGAYRFQVSRVNAPAALDFLLVEDGNLYVLTGPSSGPTGCAALGPTSLQLPTRQMVSAQATCVGEASILGENKQWWKEPSATTPGADWYWFDADADRFPFRIMPYQPLDDAGLPGLFAFSYYPEFQAVSSTDLDGLKQLCGDAPEAAGGEALDFASVDDAEAALERLLTSKAGASGTTLVPGIRSCAGTGDQPPPWDESLEMTTFLTAVNVDYSPFPSKVRYDWSTQGLRTDMYNPWPPTNAQWNLYSARLVGDKGYSIYYENDTFVQCNQDLPGPPVPNWMEADQCTCQALLEPGTALNPSSEPYYAMRCLLTQSATTPQVFWTWYGAESGRPTVFMQTNSSAAVGTGLNLADYYDWQPGATIDPSIYDIPSECDSAQHSAVPTQCHNCHLPTNEGTEERSEAEEYVPAHIPAIHLSPR